MCVFVLAYADCLFLMQGLNYGSMYTFLFVLFVCLFELIDVLCPSQEPWTFRGIASILLDFNPQLERHDIQNVRQI